MRCSLAFLTRRWGRIGRWDSVRHTARRPERVQRREAAAEPGFAGREPAPLRCAREAPSGFEPLYEALQASA